MGGNTSKKLAANCDLLTKDEQKYVANTFKAASKNSNNIRVEDLIVSGILHADLLEKLWGPQIDPRLTQFLTNYLFGFQRGNKSNTCNFNRFAELYVYNVRGSVDERLKVIYNSVGKEYSESTELPYQLLREYCESITSTYIRIVKTSSARCAKQWIEKGFRGKAANVQALGEAICCIESHEGSDVPPTQITSGDLNRWMQGNILLKSMSEVVFVTLYQVERERDISLHSSEDAERRSILCTLLPSPFGIDSMPDYPAFIDISNIVWLNSHIPQKHQHKWRFLFSSHIHGESFSTMAGRIQEAGPTLVIIEDSSGYIFGGYADESWQLNPSFYGNDHSFLFQLAPRMRIYPATNYNNHYQYMNSGTKTLPNGLMMGGQFDFGGIWINADPFGMGSSAETCSTFRGFKRLSKDPEFKIRSLEVWGVGEKPLTLKESEEEGERSILDKANPEAKAILELAGRTRHSEGIREQPPL